ncbi:MAG: HlyD family efflux transporter periplasmic adaptor subunit [Chloroflexota bacterium]|nr:HlyD family efflux transporter periplasmic adaptor subunit [Chloroflexota bacterium]
MRYISEVVLRIGRCLSPGVGVVAGMCLAALIALTGCDIELPVLQQETEVALPPDETVQREVEAQPTPQSGAKTVKVERGPITQILRSSGRVAPSLEQTLYFLSSGQMTTMYVDTKEQVEAGTLMAELDTEGLQHQRLKVLEAVERAQVQLEQARAKKVSTDTTREAADAEAARIRMELARSELESFEQGQDAVALRSAEATVAKAQADLDRLANDLATRQVALEAAQATLAAALAGPDPQAVAAAERQLEEAQLQLAKVQAGTSAEAIQSAEIALDVQRTRLSQLRDAPPVEQADVNVARLTVEQAQVNLDRAMAERGGRTDKERMRAEASVQLAQLALAAAQNSLAKVLAGGPTPWAMRLQELSVLGAENALQRLQQVQPLDIRVAELVIEQAQANLAAAQQGPSGDAVRRLRHQIAQRQRAVEAVEAAFPSAEAALESAQLRLAELKEGAAADAEYQQARYRFQVAESAHNAAVIRLAQAERAAEQAVKANALAILEAERRAEVAAMDLAWVDEQIAKAQIFAPFDGVIARIEVRPVKNVNAFQPIIKVSNQDELVIRASLSQSDIPKLALGQMAKITINDFPGVILDGVLIGLPAQYATAQADISDNSAIFQVEWPKAGAEADMRARLEIAIQHREDTLVVPTRVIHSTGRRRYVETLEDGVKRTRNVELGIVGDDIVEILDGLEEGMVIIERS